MSSPPVIRPANSSLPRVPTPDTAAIAKIKSLLRQYIRVSTNDGRIFIGTFAGTDKLLNIILTNTEEYRIQGTDDPPDGRYVSLVMIPWRHVVSVEAPARWIQNWNQKVSPDNSMYF